MTTQPVSNNVPGPQDKGVTRNPASHNAATTVIALLEQGYPIPYIACYLKDETGGLGESEVAALAQSHAKQKKLTTRKETILNNLRGREILGERLEKSIRQAKTARRLEDLYLPYKPGRTTEGAAAHENGLDLLALDIIEGTLPQANLLEKAAEFLKPEKGLDTAEKVLDQVKLLIRELFSENVELRQRLRELIRQQGRIISTVVDSGEATPRAPKKGAKESRPAQTESPVPAETQLATPADAEADVPVTAETLESEKAETATAEQTDDPATPPCPAPTSESAPSGETAPSDETVPSGEATPTEPVDGSGVETVGTPAETAADSQAASDSKSSTAKPAKKVQKVLVREQKSQQSQKLYGDYFHFATDLRLCPWNRLLGLTLAEKAGAVTVRIDCPEDKLLAEAVKILVPETHPCRELLVECVSEVCHDFLFDMLKRQVRRDMVEQAPEQAMETFGRNLKKLLLSHPLTGTKVLAFLPGFSHGCRLVALDEFGNILGMETIFITGGAERRRKAVTLVQNLIEKYKLQVIAVGGGTGVREAEDFIVKSLMGPEGTANLSYVVVNDAGVADYAVSQAGKDEFPRYSPQTRTAIAIGRRLQDPLAEMVKLDPGLLVIGTPQYDLKLSQIRDSLSSVLVSCVNEVGVNLNLATTHQLRYVSGLNLLTASRIVEYRKEHGPFRRREDLKKVPGVTETVFRYAAGFLRIDNGWEPLDRTWIHPDCYAVTRALLEKLGFTPEDLKDKERADRLAAAIECADATALANEFSTGPETMRHILAELACPGCDLRDSVPLPILKKGNIHFEDLVVGTEYKGTIQNVTDFGAFVDIGTPEAGLIHVSQMGDRYIHNPHGRLTVGSVVRVKVIGVDEKRRRISLALVVASDSRGRGEKGRTSEGQNEARRRPRRDSRRREESGTRNDRHTVPPTGNASAEQGKSRTESDAPRARSGQGYGTREQKYSPRDASSAGRERAPRRDRNDRGPREKSPRVVIAPPKEKKVVALSDDMKQGKVPMRSFSDLAQLFGRVAPAPEESTRKEKLSNASSAKTKAATAPATADSGAPADSVATGASGEQGTDKD